MSNKECTSCTNKTFSSLTNWIRFRLLLKREMDKESIYLLENFTTWIVSSVFESGSRFRSFGEGRNHDEPFPFRTMARHFRAHRVDFACSQIHGTIIDGDRPLEGSSAALSKVQRAGCSTRGTSHVRFAKAASLFISESCAANVKINETRGEGYKDEGKLIVFQSNTLIFGYKI